MNEAEWLRGTDPTPMLEFLRGKGPSNENSAWAFSPATALPRVKASS